MAQNNYRWFRLKLTNHWRRGLPGLVAVAGMIAAALAASFTAAEPATRVLHFGVILELLGLLTVAVGIAGVRRRFSQPSILGQIAAWFRDMPRLFRKPDPVAIQLPFIDSQGVVFTPTHAPSRPASTQEVDRIKSLERRLGSIELEIRALHTAVERQVKELESTFENQRASIHSGLAELHALLVETAVGGLRLEAIGLVWLTVGALSSGIPRGMVAVIRAVLR